MGTVVRDDSIGQALAGLAGNLFNPKREWEAKYLKQRIDSSAADAAKIQLEAENLRRQQQAQDGLITQFNAMLTPEALNLPKTVTQSAPSPDFVGPMPDVPNPQLNGLQGRLALAQALARNAVMRGGTPDQVMSSGMTALGLGQIYGRGALAPTEDQARYESTLLSAGKVPDANTPLTESQRVRMFDEQQRAKLLDAISIPKDGTVLMSPEQGAIMGVKPNAQGQFTAQGPHPQAGLLAGNATDAQAANIILQYREAERTGQPITPQLRDAYAWAFNHAYGPKTEARALPGGGMESVTIQPTIPNGFAAPGSASGTSAGTAPQMAQPPVSAPVSAPMPDGPAPGAPSLPSQGASGPGTQSAPPAFPLPALPSVGGITTQTLRPGKPELPPEHTKRTSTFIQTMDDSLHSMEAMLGKGFRPSMMGEILGPQGQPGGGGLWNQAQTVLMRNGQSALAPDDAKFSTHMMSFLNAVLRDESGAAVPEQEYPKYIAALIPTSADDDQTIAAKVRNMRMAVEARRAGLDLKTISGIALGQNPAANTVDAQGAGGAGPARPVDAERKRVLARQELDGFLRDLDASSLPASEKARRRAEATRRFNATIGQGAK